MSAFLLKMIWDLGFEKRAKNKPVARAKAISPVSAMADAIMSEERQAGLTAPYPTVAAAAGYELFERRGYG